MNRLQIISLALTALSIGGANAQNYRIVDTGQSKSFDDKSAIVAPARGEAFYGQDSQYQGLEASYTDNGDGTVTDNVTGLMWQRGYDVMSYEEALKAAETFELAGYDDWRVPSIKEAYSLILFSGCDVSPQATAEGGVAGTPFINTSIFDFKYASNGSRAIDTQMATTSLYVGSTERETLLFGVNFADGRIKGYGLGLGGRAKEFTVRFVRGEEYGVNEFVDGGDGTVRDQATSLMWSKGDSQRAMNWQEALAYAEEMNAEGYLGYNDWRVPNAKELQSIVDYSRSPLTTSSAAIDPIFDVTKITDEAGVEDYPFYWTSTTHENSGASRGGAAVYVAFGRSLGNMSNMQGQQSGQRQRQQQMGQMRQQGQQREQGGRSAVSSEPNWIDVHGAGSQRSDPKSGDPSIYANGHGPQGDVIRIYNYVRLVRDL